MKIINKPVEVISWFDYEGHMTPIRFRIVGSNDVEEVYKVQRIVEKSFEKPAGNPMWVFTCVCFEAGVQRLFVLKYELSTCRWILFKG